MLAAWMGALLLARTHHAHFRDGSLICASAPILDHALHVARCENTRRVALVGSPTDAFLPLAAQQTTQTMPNQTAPLASPTPQGHTARYRT